MKRYGNHLALPVSPPTVLLTAKLIDIANYNLHLLCPVDKVSHSLSLVCIEPLRSTSWLHFNSSEVAHGLLVVQLLFPGHAVLNPIPAAGPPVEVLPWMLVTCTCKRNELLSFLTLTSGRATRSSRQGLLQEPGSTCGDFVQ